MPSGSFADAGNCKGNGYIVYVECKVLCYPANKLCQLLQVYNFPPYLTLGLMVLIIAYQVMLVRVLQCF